MTMPIPRSHFFRPETKGPCETRNRFRDEKTCPRAATLTERRRNDGASSSAAGSREDPSHPWDCMILSDFATELSFHPEIQTQNWSQRPENMEEKCSLVNKHGITQFYMEHPQLCRYCMGYDPPTILPLYHHKTTNQSTFNQPPFLTSRPKCLPYKSPENGWSSFILAV